MFLYYIIFFLSFTNLILSSLPVLALYFLVVIFLYSLMLFGLFYIVPFFENKKTVNLFDLLFLDKLLIFS